MLFCFDVELILIFVQYPLFKNVFFRYCSVLYVSQRASAFQIFSPVTPASAFSKFNSLASLPSPPHPTPLLQRRSVFLLKKKSVVNPFILIHTNAGLELKTAPLVQHLSGPLTCSFSPFDSNTTTIHKHTSNWLEFATEVVVRASLHFVTENELIKTQTKMTN